MNPNREPRFLPLLTALALLSVALPATGQDLSGGTPGEWLSRYTSARTVGMGGSFVATANEPLGMLWNPAGLTRMNQNEVHFETARLFEDTALHGVSFAMPGRSLPSFGVSVVALRSGAFEKTNDLNEIQGEFNESDMAFIFSTSKNVYKRLSLGANVKVIRQAIDEFDATGVGADLGVLFDVTPTFRVGTSLLNVAGPSLTLRDTAESYPMEIRSGLSMQFLDGRGLVSAELDHSEGPGVTLRGGSEYWVHPSMALRAGYDDTSPTGGFSYRVKPDMRFDYGVSSHELGVTHRVGISYRFGGFHARSEANPPAFSPLGAQAVTKFELKAYAKADIDKWTLEIHDKQDQVVRQFSGQGQPPSHVMWDGKGESGLPLPDGLYTYALTVEDAEGAALIAHERIVEITTEGPRGSIPVVVD
ncbi:MAG TPA: PorV/PorQ family protein [bacterium]|nr:PorV/PorQ family protein [bacterium]